MEQFKLKPGNNLVGSSYLILNETLSPCFLGVTLIQNFWNLINRNGEAYKGITN